MIPWNAMGYATLFYQVGGIDDAKISILENQQQPTNSTNQWTYIKTTDFKKNQATIGCGSFFCWAA